MSRCCNRCYRSPPRCSVPRGRVRREKRRDHVPSLKNAKLFFLSCGETATTDREPASRTQDRHLRKQRTTGVPQSRNHRAGSASVSVLEVACHRVALPVWWLACSARLKCCRCEVTTWTLNAARCESALPRRKPKTAVASEKGHSFLKSTGRRKNSFLNPMANRDRTTNRRPTFEKIIRQATARPRWTKRLCMDYVRELVSPRC